MKTQLFYQNTRGVPSNVLKDHNKFKDEWLGDHLYSEFLEGIEGCGDLGYLIQEWVSKFGGVKVIDQNGWTYSYDFIMEGDGLLKFNLYPYNWIFEDGREWDLDWGGEDNYLNESKSNGHIIHVEGYAIDTSDQVFFVTKIAFSDKLP